MPVSAYFKFDCFVQDMARGLHNLHTDVIKGMLTNTLPVVGNTVKTSITEISAGNGYSAGGLVLSLPGATQTGGLLKVSVVASDPSWLASGGSIGPFRWLVAFNDTSATKPLISWFDYGAPLTLGVGESLVVDADQTNGLLQIQ